MSDGDWYRRDGCIWNFHRVTEPFSSVVLPQPDDRQQRRIKAQFGEIELKANKPTGVTTTKHAVKRKREPAYRSPFPETR